MSTKGRRSLSGRIFSPTRVRRRTVVAIVALVAVGTGSAIAATDGSASSDPSADIGAQVHDTGIPLTYSATTLPPRLVGTSLRNAIPQVVGGMNGLVLAITPRLSVDRPVVQIHLARSNDDVPDVWAAGLTVGALGELIHTDESALSQVFAAASATGAGRDGPATWTGVGLGATSLGQRFGSPRDAELARRTDQAARAFHLTVSSLRILHPLESAIDVTFTVPDDRMSHWTLDELRARLVPGATPDVEGILIRVNSASGRPLATSGIAYRTGEHGLWCAPGVQAQCGGGPIFSTPGREDP